MCGISRLVNTKTYDENDVKKMISCIAHRGPDEQDLINLGNEHCSGIHDHTRSLRTLLITSAWMSQKPNKQY